ncbi:unnamed protein product [Amoebophrya sp. A120]|nr:unnamed protein product [Amoebophrya sp. A120]|eukprot:GSA120T00006585001.1
MATFGKIHAGLREFFRSGKTQPISYRIERLEELRRRLLANEENIIRAVQADMQRNYQDCFVSDFVMLVSEIDQTIANLPEWAKPEPRATPLIMQPGNSEVQFQPKGVVLVITPWNYPVSTCVTGAIAAIAAGNVSLSIEFLTTSYVLDTTSDLLLIAFHASLQLRFGLRSIYLRIERESGKEASNCMMYSGCASSTNTQVPLLKPSEVTENSCRVLVDKIFKDFEGAGIVEGGPAETQELLKLQFDHIIFTGGSGIAKHVYRAAAENLTPCTLELGGKSPVFLDKKENFGSDQKFEIALKRILWSKHLNAGQTCVAADYVLVHEEDLQSTVEQMKAIWRQFYIDPKSNSPCANATPASCPDYGSAVVSERHFDRVFSMLKEDHGGKVVLGGIAEEKNFDRSKKHLGLTIVVNPKDDCRLSTEEIFGPILVVRTFGTEVEMTDYVNARPHPLAVYAFSGDKNAAFVNFIKENTISGGFVANDVIIQAAHAQLPFGGVGNSGFGKLHGQDGFKELSHCRGVLNRSFFMDSPERYPPFYQETLGFYRRFLVDNSLLGALLCKKRSRTRFLPAAAASSGGA